MTSLVLPSTREEAWRWSDLSALPALAGASASGRRYDIASLWLDCGGPRLLFVDGVLDEAASDPRGLAIGKVAADAGGHPLGRLAEGDGWTLELGDEHAAPGLIEIIHVSTGGANHAAARIALAADAQASVVESFVGDGWANRLTDIHLARGARLMRAVRLAQDSGFTSVLAQADLGAGASFVSVLIGEGGAGTRIDGTIRIGGEGAYAEIGGALLARDEQRHDVNVVVRHDAHAGVSRQIWRSVADDRAIASIAARVEVTRQAQKTDAEQSLRGLLLKRSATANLKPELEIFADDVKCAHGATVGELDRNALFYLASRGVPPQEAQALLTRAFVADALARIGEEKVRDTFSREAEDWLGGRA